MPAPEGSKDQTPPHDLVIDGARTPSNISWPVALDHKLDGYVAGLYEMNMKTSRAELLSAIIATANLGSDELRQMLRDYRTLLVGDIVMGLRPSETDPPDLDA